MADDPSFIPDELFSDTSIPDAPNDPSFLPGEVFSDDSVPADPTLILNTSDTDSDLTMPETVHNMTLSVSPRLISSAAICEFFADLQRQLSNCCMFDELQTVVKQATPEVGTYPIPQVIPRCLIDVGIVDKVANDLVPDFLKPLFPVLTVANGNCVPRALSLACFGDQDHHTEMRCRIVMELASNCLDYICLDSNDLNLLHMLSDSYNLI